MQALSQPRAVEWEEYPPDLALDLIDAAVCDAQAGVLVVVRRDGVPEVAYANAAMQDMTGDLLGERPQVRLADVPVFGGPLSRLLEAARAQGGRLEQRIVIQERHGELAVAVDVRQCSPDGTCHLLKLEVDEAEPATTADGEDPAAAACGSAAGIGYWHWDLVTGGAWYDGAALAMLNGAGREPSAKLLHARVHDNDRNVLLNAIRRHLEQNLPLDIEFRLRPPGVSWLRLRGSASRDAAGLPVRLSGMLEDVTARREAYEDLRGTQEFLKSLLDSLPTCIAVLGPGGEIVELNRAWVEFPSAAGLAGQRFGFGTNYAVLARAAQERCAAGNAAADGIERLIAAEDEEFLLGYRVVCLEGGERAMQMLARAFESPRGRMIVVTHNDVTGLDRATRAIRDNEAFYRMILNALPLYVSYVNAQRELLHANRLAEEWLGQPIEVLRGHRLDEMMDAPSYAGLDERVKRVLRGRRVDFETRLARDARDVDLAVSYVPHVVDGKVEGFLSVARDITQEKRLESELLQSQKMEAMGRLTGGIAHDFNNLLSVIIGNLQLTEREVADHASPLAHVRTALGAATRGADLTRRLLSFARPKTREAKPIDANNLIGGLADLISRTIGSAIELGLDLEAQAWPIRVDAGELENALLNLAINARDAMPDGGALKVSTRNLRLAEPDAPQSSSLPAGDYTEVSVGDTGCGMPPEVMRKAFEPFFTTKAPGKGTGLGLSIVYGFASRSGGTAIIESEPGEGTVVRLLFPRCHAPEGEPDAERPAILLLVAVPEAAAGVLRTAGYGVATVATLDAATQYLADGQRPDLVVVAAAAATDATPSSIHRRLQERGPDLRVLCLTGSECAGPVSSTDPDAGDELVRAVRHALAQESAENV